MKQSLTILVGLMALIGLTALTARAQEETTVFIEDFDGVTPPALPVGWTDPAAEWVTSSSVSSTGSGANNLTVSGVQAASVQTPVLDLSGMTTGTLSYLARRTSTYAMDNLIVRASIDGGATFPIIALDQGAALPATDGSYDLVSMTMPAALLGESQVVLSFEALGGTTSGSNIRIDDLEITGDGGMVTTESVFGFTAETGAANAGTIDVNLMLDFANMDSLQGIQFDVDWDVSAINFVEVIRGDAVTDGLAWEINAEARDTEMRVILLGDRSSALPEGGYDPLLTLRFSVDPANTATEGILTLSNVVGALALRTGDDAGLTLGQAIHTVTLDAGVPTFEPDALSLDAGTVLVNETSETTLTVTNTGTADLVVSSVVSNNGLFTVEPATATVMPGASGAFAVSYVPTATVFGYQEAVLTFAHNASGGSTDIEISGIGIGGRGDMSQDGTVDVLDLVLGVDYTLEREVPAPEQLVSADVHPFGTPDGAIDVRDLTVLSQAIVLGVWPDEVSLPVDVIPGAAPAKQGGVFVGVSNTSDGIVLGLKHDVPLLGLQFTLSVDTPAEQPVLMADELIAAGVHLESHYNEEKGYFKVLAVRFDGEMIEPGNHNLAMIASTVSSFQLVHGIVVDASRSRVAVGFGDTELTADEREIPQASGFQLGAPFPNPFKRTTGDALAIPLILATAQPIGLEVFDILGRKVHEVESRRLDLGNQRLAWNGLDQQGKSVASGLYLIRVTAGKNVDTRLVIVE